VGKKEWVDILENKFQRNLVNEIKQRFKGAIVLKNNGNYIQGIPDIIILYKDTWASLEVKQHQNAKKQPNQDFYVKLMGEMSFSAFIYPENKEDVLHAMEQSFRNRGRTCVSESK
jgi:Holliday junction resolvase-like predicted endonuclease